MTTMLDDHRRMRLWSSKQEYGAAGVNGWSLKFRGSAASTPESAPFSFPVLEQVERRRVNRSDQEIRGSDDATENGSVGKTTLA